MKTFDTIYKDDTLNIFTDASMYAENYNGLCVGCSGVELATSINRTDVINHLYPTGYIPNYSLNLDTTNNNSELIAIRQGVLFAIANKYRFKEINLFSDSLISVKSLTDWIEGWFYKSINNKQDRFEMNLITSSGTPVANQDLIKNIVALIYYNNLNINFYHQRGHLSNNLLKVKKDFIKNNQIKCNVSDNFIKEITQLNDIVDRRSRDIMRNFIKTGYAPYIINNAVISGINYDISCIDIKKYKKLIGKGR